MKRIILTLMILPPLLMAAGCSVVFTGSITGELHDADAYDAGDAASGIADAEVYLYTEEEPWAEDLAAWSGGTGPLPDYPVDADGNALEPRYFLKTVTDTDGTFTFNGFIWEELFPVYGKSGDRKEVFMLYHQRDYGLTGNDTPIFIVSNVTNRLPPISLAKIVNTAVIDGIVQDKSSGEGIANVNVDIYIPESWEYDGSGAMIDEVWPEEPSYSLVTGPTGEYTTEISFPRIPATEDRGTTRVRITFNHNRYRTNNSIDSDITDTGWDADGDDTDDPYYQSDYISKDRSETMDTIEMRRFEFTGNLEGRVYEDSIGDPNALNGRMVKLFITDSPSSPETIDGDRIASTNYTLIGESTLWGGYFSIENIEWTDEDSTGTQSTQTCYIYIQDSFNDNWPVKPASGELTLTSDITTWVDVVTDTDGP